VLLPPFLPFFVNHTLLPSILFFPYERATLSNEPTCKPTHANNPVNQLKSYLPICTNTYSTIKTA